MGLPADHAVLAQRTGFPVPADAPLDDHERSLLARFGHWLAALADGSLAPTTAEQRQFVRAARGDAEPRSAFEVAWAKYRQAAAPVADVGPLELADRLARLAAAREAAAAVRDEYAARREAVLAKVRADLDAVDAEFADRLAAAEAEAAEREAEARAAALAHGRSFRHAGVHAVWCRGRVTWDGKGLERLAADHPEVGQFRRVGPASVSLRFDRPG